MRVTARSRVSDERTPRSAIEEPRWYCRIIVIARRYDPGGKAWYPHTGYLSFNVSIE